MSKVAITLYGREHFVNCDPGDEDRLREVVKIVEARMHKVAERAGTATVTDMRHYVLTCLSFADEIYELRQNAERSQRMEEDIMVAAVDHLKQRIAHIASQVGRA
jgi:cell division protein ZapA (FtsZ GTPase activity inhibitor)